MPPKKDMTDFDLLSAVQPDAGWFAILGIKGTDDVKQKMVNSREAADKIIASFVKDDRNVFFSLAKFHTGENRTHANVRALKAFWLDIDCGDGKEEVNEKTGRPSGYVDQTAGLMALRAFCKATGFPRPTVVNSGRGIHAYWALDHEITFTEWSPVAKRLRVLCQEHKFHIDTSVFEISRVLRVPGTYNFKGDVPKQVQVISHSEPVSYESFKKQAGVSETFLTEARPRRELTALGKAMANTIESKFATIMIKSTKGTGCSQLLSCYMERAELPEPRWFDALSIAKFCVDSEFAIHQLSAGHPGYNPEVVEKKIMGIKGPHSCEEFENKNPGGCEGCPHKGKITSPISLGKTVARANKQDNSVEVESEDGVPVAHEIPTYPFPFFRGKGGGIYMNPDEEEAEPICIYENDLYINKLMRDPILHYVACFKLHLPMDGVSEFVVPYSDLNDSKTAKKHLSGQGVAISGTRKWDLLFQFIINSIKELQHKQRAELMRLQFGWADKDTKFIIGDREVTASGVYHSPPSSVTSSMISNFQPKGELSEWKRVFKLYGRPGMELHAFAALTGFGAPLLKFTGQKGAIINLIHSKSGQGKTTVLRMCNSIMGNPETLLGTPDDTKVGRIIKVGILNNLANTIDELTNTSAPDFSQMAYAFSQGRGKDKAKANANELRENNTTWRTITLCSSNASFYEKLGALKSSPDGEMMRLLEFKIDYTNADVISVAEGKEMFDHVLNENYGLAGEVYMSWVIANLEQVHKIIFRIQQKFDEELQLSQRERNWSAVFAANIAGGIIAEKLGLIDWNMTAIYKAVGPKLLEMREDASAPISLASSIVADYINRHLGNAIVVDDKIDQRTKVHKLPVMEPKGPLLIRYEPDTKRLYLIAREFKNDCVELQVNYREMMKELTAGGLLIGITNKRMTKGSKIVTPAVRVLEFDCSKPDFIDMDAVVPALDETLVNET